MFSYSPQVADRSGEIIAAGQVGAAQANAQMMGQMGENIGGALQAIGGMYGEIESQKAKGRAFKDVFKVVSPSLGMSMEQLESVAGGKLKNDRDWFKASEMLMPMMPALINSQLGQQRIEQAPALQDQRTNDQRDIMYERERLQREREVMNTPQGPAPVTVPTAMRRFNKPI
jgi:hypothetical protein